MQFSESAISLLTLLAFGWRQEHMVLTEKNRKKPQLDNKNRSLENKYLQPVHGINRLFSGILKYSI